MNLTKLKNMLQNERDKGVFHNGHKYGVNHPDPTETARIRMVALELLIELAEDDDCENNDEWVYDPNE